MYGATTTPTKARKQKPLSCSNMNPGAIIRRYKSRFWYLSGSRVRQNIGAHVVRRIPDAASCCPTAAPPATGESSSPRPVFVEHATHTHSRSGNTPEDSKATQLRPNYQKHQKSTKVRMNRVPHMFANAGKSWPLTEEAAATAPPAAVPPQTTRRYAFA